jgi:FecR protein
MTPEEEEALRVLLRWAGRRPAPPAEVTAAVYQNTRSAWLAQVQRQNSVRRVYAWAAGFVAFAIAGWGVWNLYPHQTLALVPEGQALRIKHTFWHPFAEERRGPLYQGDALETSAKGALVHQGDGNELVVSANTRLSFPSANTVRLSSGRVYVQAKGLPPAHTLVVRTRLGSIEHLGTQFLVGLEEASLLVAVRDGRVAVHYLQDQALELKDGEAARVDPGGKLRRWDLEAFDGTWDWADKLSPPLVIDGQSLYAVLSQIAQRSGLTLRFATPEAEAHARSLVLHGAPIALQPRDALAAVLATTTFTNTTMGREIVVSAN